MVESQITVIGSINYDIIMKQKRLPQIGETLECDDLFMRGGGKGANQAVQIAKLGVRPNLIGAVGDDSFSEKILNNFVNLNISDKYITVKKDCSAGIGVVNSLEDGRLVSTVYPGANREFSILDLAKDRDIILQSKVLIMQLELPLAILEYVYDLIKDTNIVLILNPSPAQTIPQEILKRVDFLIVNEVEASFYANAEISDYQSSLKHYQSILNLINGVVVITLGENGSLICKADGATYIEPMRVDAVDTTGAGDSYMGAFVVKWLETGDIELSAKFATQVSSITVMNVGAQDAMPSKHDLVKK